MLLNIAYLWGSGAVIVGWKSILYIIGQALDNFCEWRKDRGTKISWVRLPCFSVFLQHLSMRVNNFLFTRNSSVSVHCGRSFCRTWERQMLPEVHMDVQAKGNYCQVLFFCHNLDICSWTETDWMMHYLDLAQYFTCSFSGKYWTIFRVCNQLNIKPVILIYQHWPWKIYQENYFCSNYAFNVKYLS